MCTPADDNILIVGTTVGSIDLYDLKEYDTSPFRNDNLDYISLLKFLQPNCFEEEGETNVQEKLKVIKNRYQMQHPTFSTDGLPNYQHFSPIRKLVFVTKFGSGNAQIGVMDELLTISTWSMIELQSHIADKLNDFDLNMSVGGKFKLLENFSISLMDLPEVMGKDIADISQSLEIEFDPIDPNTLYFSSSEGLFIFNRSQSPVPCRIDT